MELNLPLVCNRIIRGYLSYAERVRFMLTVAAPNVPLARCMLRLQILHVYAGIMIEHDQLLRLQICVLIADIHESLRQQQLQLP